MRRNWLDQVVLVVSIVAIAAVVGFLVVTGLTERGRPPDPAVELHLDRARESELGWIVPLTIANHGGRAAEAVRIEATVSVGGEIETRQLEIDFLPAGSGVEAEVAFSARPDGDIVVELIGHRLP